MGGSFGLGGGSTKTKSQQTQESYGYSGSNSLQSSYGASQSTSGGQSTTGQSVAFEDLFAQLFGNASNVAGQMAGNTGGLTDQANQLFSGGTQFLQQLSGNAGEDYLAGRLSGDTGILDQQIQGLGADIGQFFNEQINPGITADAVSGGALGGGRQGVAQGMAAQAAGREFQTGVTNLRAMDQQQRDAAAGQLGTMRTSAATGALSALPGMFDVAQGGFNAQLAPYQALSSIMGGPMALTQGQSTNFSQASSEDIARAISAAFGEDFSKGQSTSSGKSWNFNMTGGGGLFGG